MALVGVQPTRTTPKVPYNFKPNKGSINPGNPGLKKELEKELADVKAELAELQENPAEDYLQAHIDFMEQFEEVLKLDNAGIKKICEDLGMEVKGNTAIKDLLLEIFNSMQKTMLST